MTDSQSYSLFGGVIPGLEDTVVTGTANVDFYEVTGYFDAHGATAPIPEPATITLLGIGLAGLAGVAARRKWKNKAPKKS